MRKSPPSPDGRLRVILWGLGALGAQIMKSFQAGVPDIRVVGVIDHAPSMAGQKLAAISPEAKALGIDLTVAPTLDACLAALREPADAVYHMTESVLDAIEPQMVAALDRGLNVISASEAMFHPTLRFPAIAFRLDQAGKRNGVSITGCGINPGFVFDSLVLALARVTTAVKSIRISRCIDVTGTGAHDIDHVGYGLTPEDFHAKIASGRIVGHMGMPESIAAIGERLAMPIDRIEERWDIETAKFPVDSGTDALGILPPGRVIGITQFGSGFSGAEEAIAMKLSMYYRPEKFGLAEADDITIDGSHRVHATLSPAAVSIQGAALMIINATADIVAAPPGLHNVLDFSMGGRRRGMFRHVTDPARPPQPGKVWLVRAPA
jgi:2,4-diaminopentanoate dehydrogenase